MRGVIILSMNVTIYNTTDDNAVVSKTLTDAVTLPVIVPTEGIDLDTPALTVQYNTSALTANYCKLTIAEGSPAVDKYAAYYFIKQRDVFPAEKIILHCELDVLYTYAVGIRNSNANVIRSQSEGISYVKDDKLPVNPSQFALYTDSLKDNVFSHGNYTNYVLCVNTAVEEAQYYGKFRR